MKYPHNDYYFPKYTKFCDVLGNMLSYIYIGSYKPEKSGTIAYHKQKLDPHKGL